MIYAAVFLGGCFMGAISLLILAAFVVGSEEDYYD